MSDPNQEFQPPPPPAFAPPQEPAGPEMSTPGTLTGIFFEPTRVFEALRTRPRFLIATLVLTLLTLGVTLALYARIDMGEFIRTKMEQSQRGSGQTPEQQEMGVKIGKIAGMVIPPLAAPAIVFIGAALYLLGVMAFGGSITYKKSLSVWAYSSLPPAVLGSVVAMLVLFLKASDQVDPEHLLVTNPGAFMSSGTSPVLVALLGEFDLLKFYGLFLAALGLRKMAKMSSGAAWGVVLTLTIIGAVFKVASAAIFGR